MWLKIVYVEDDILKWPNEKNRISVQISYEMSAPINGEMQSFRISPIFPLVPSDDQFFLDDTWIHFYSFSEAYSIIGRVQQLGSEELTRATYFSHGLASILLISKSEEIAKEFQAITGREPLAEEHWTIRNSLISEISYNIKGVTDSDALKFELTDYSLLDATERALIDEFHASIRLLLVKLVKHMPSESDKILKLISQVNRFIETLVYLTTFKGKLPSYLSDYKTKDLQDAREIGKIKNQLIERIIQINSSLSYVSTQAFSGAIPILERRSLIRRYSLLGIGSAILALNNIARFIEICFSKIPIVSIIEITMPIASPINGLQLPNYYDGVRDWRLSSVDHIKQHDHDEHTFFKLPYFNGRLGFRETEFSIAAAIQSVSSGASLEWSLMTLTHEMTHGHVRKILNTLFFGDDSTSVPKLRKEFYQNFKRQKNGTLKNGMLIDDMRAIIFTYCCMSYDFGSLTVQKATKSGTAVFHLLSQELVFEIFEEEYRNISEIFVHVLDLHYFYAGRYSVYIPLIWGSWVAVPYTASDLRQYILRSLLAIASKTSGKAPNRFKESVGILRKLLSLYNNDKLKHPIIHAVIAILDDIKLLDTYYYAAFKTSLIIVDLAYEVFYSRTIRASIFADELVEWKKEGPGEENMETVFSYNLEPGYNDATIESPIAFLLDRMIDELQNSESQKDIERKTVIQFLALNCRKPK